MWQLGYFSKEPYEMNTIILTFQMKQLRLREVKIFVQGHSASKRQNLPLSPDPPSHTQVMK